jgi:hypothetical protein
MPTTLHGFVHALPTHDAHAQQTRPYNDNGMRVAVSVDRHDPDDASLASAARPAAVG